MAESTIKANKQASRQLANGVKYQKCGGLCIVTFEGYSTSSTGQVSVGFLPQGYKPEYTAQGCLSLGANTILPVYCLTNGEVKMNKSSPSTGGIAGELIFVIGQ